MIYVVGCNHRVQRTDVRGIWEEMSLLDPKVRRADEEEKKRFAARLEEIIGRYGICWIVEESDPTRRYVGQVLAEKHRCVYKCITMDREKRRTYGVPDNYKRDPETRAAAHRVFEQHFFNEVWCNRERGKPVLMIIGTLHMNRVAALFRQAGEDEVITEQFGPLEESDC